MSSRNYLSVLSVLVIVFAKSLAQDQKLTCYECAGYDEAEPQDPIFNTPDCNLDTFNPDKLRTVTNTSTDPSHPLLCYTIAVFVRDLNGDRPFTVRDMVSTLVPEQDLVKALKSQHDASRLVKENRKMFIKGEMCLYDYCNDGTGTFNSTGRTSIAPVLVLLALCLHRLLM